MKAKDIVEKQISQIPRVRNRKIINELIEQKWPHSLDQFHIECEDDFIPEEGAWLYMNLSSLDHTLEITVTDSSGEHAPSEGAPIFIRVFNDSMLLAKAIVTPN